MNEEERFEMIASFTGWSFLAFIMVKQAIALESLTPDSPQKVVDKVFDEIEIPDPFAYSIRKTLEEKTIPKLRENKLATLN